MELGDVVTLNTPMLDCRPGTRGVVFNIYQDFDDKSKQGVQIIFENGNYDGFSYDDQKYFLKEEKVFPYQKLPYEFTNVIKLSQDFKKGYWDNIFRYFCLI